MRPYLLLFGMAALLVAGCIGGQGDSGPAGNAPSGASQPAQPAVSPGGSVGDADLAQDAGDDEVEVPAEDLVPPQPDAAVSETSGFQLDDGDIDVDIAEEDLEIFEGDVVEPI